jgi:putative ubiquitin-RnfH superfamily antitoxin RatB of RatAB toxin-antitoxin module
MAEAAVPPSEAAPSLEVSVVACIAPRSTREWHVALPAGACVADALKACADLEHVWGGLRALQDADVGVWGRGADRSTPLKHLDRVEIYRPLTVDPKVARRERFARQGARTTGLFARQRPGGKSGY